MTAASPAGSGVSSASGAPLFSLRDVRIDEAGAPRFDMVDASQAVGTSGSGATGFHVLVLGAPRALFLASTGELAVTRGALLLTGLPPTRAVRDNRVAVARFDVPVPPAWSARKYATWRARLAGNAKRLAEGLADEALARFEIDPKARPAELAEPMRRGFHVAAACATDAPCLLLDDVTAGLADGDAAGLARVLTVALDRRSWILFARHVALDSRLGLAADEALVFSGSALVASGPPAEVAAAERSYAVGVAGPRAAFVSACRARGIVVSDLTTAATGAAAAGATGALLRLELTAEGRTRDLFHDAAATGCTIVELRPFASALA